MKIVLDFIEHITKIIFDTKNKVVIYSILFFMFFVIAYVLYEKDPPPLVDIETVQDLKLPLRVKKFALGFLIETEEDVEAIEKDQDVYRSVHNVIGIGAMVVDNGGGGLSIIPKSKVRTFCIVKLDKEVNKDYSNGFVYDPNIYYTFKKDLHARFITDKKELNTIEYCKGVIVKLKHRLAINNLLIKNEDSTYYIATTENFNIDDPLRRVAIQVFNYELLLAKHTKNNLTNI